VFFVCLVKNRRRKKEVGAEYNCNLGDRDRTFYVLEAGTSSKPATLILEGNYDITAQSWTNANTVKLDEIAEVWTELDRSQLGLPSAGQLAAASNISLEDFTKGSQISSWLYSYPGHEDWVAIGPVYGYWTSTLDAESSGQAYRVYADGTPGFANVDDDYIGVRPVILLGV